MPLFSQIATQLTLIVSDMTRGSELLQGYPRMLGEYENVPMQIPHGTD